MTTLVGGVGQLYQGDLDLGRIVVERLACEELGPGVLVEELSYGAVAVAQRLDEIRPETFILVGAAERGRPAGTIERRVASQLDVAPAEVQLAVADAVTGYVSVDLLLEVASGLGSLPPRTVVVEVEPARTESSDALSPVAAAALEEMLELVREEVSRARAGC